MPKILKILRKAQVPHVMNINFIIFSVLISVICVLLALVQYYYFNFKKATSVRTYDPYFRDLIPSPTPNYYLHYDQANFLPANEKKTKKTKFQSSESEIEHCLKAALAYKLTGKSEKALKLFEHAAAIAPNNADVLNIYGEFLEEQQKDVLSADELYFRALSYKPDHSGALTNRKRTADVVDQLDLIMFSLIDDKRDQLKENFDSNVDYEKRKTAFYLHIYHSVGIEGNTMTVNQLQYLLETGKAVSGKSIIEHNEILGLEIAFRFVKLLSSRNSVEINDILEIHRRVMGHVEPLASGIFRDQQVFVGSHVPPPPEDLSKCMDDYIDWINSEEAQRMHPVRLAALAHYKLVDIHPFTDGNGRTSRLIMNLILLKTGYPPVIIYKEDRHKYYEYLNVANTGDVRPFVRFIAFCTDETLNTYLGINTKLSRITHEIDFPSPVIQDQGIVVAG